MKTVMQRLRELREDHDLTQTQIAELLGIEQQYYSKYEVGAHDLPLRHFITLANYYHVSADYLIGRCKLDEKTHLKTVYVTKDCTAEELLRDILSLKAEGRKSVIEYVEFQKSRESREAAKKRDS